MKKNLGVLTGVLTTIVFLWIGIQLLMSGQKWAVLLVVAGMVRGGYAFREWQDTRAEEE